MLSAIHNADTRVLRQPTRLEGLSRTMRSYVPSSISIPIPSAAPSPPRVSLPVSFGSFMSPTGAPEEQGDRRRSWGTDAGGKTLEEVLALSENERPGLSRYPGSDQGESITWARWDTLNPGRARRLLFLGYRSGLQIWDCSQLDSITEVLNLPSTDWGHVWSAAILPPPSTTLDDRFSRARPTVGVIAKRPLQNPEFIVYSLAAQQVLEKLFVPGLVSFSSSPNFILLSTSKPSTLRIISPCTLATLFIIPHHSLSAFARPSSKNLNDDTNHNVLPPHTLDSEDAPPADLQPVFALSGRLLAFSSPPPRVDFSHQVVTSTQPRTRSPVRADTTGSLSQADIGNMAMRVGGSVLSGMRSLGAMAFTAARTRIATDTPPEAQTPRSPTFSRSAPAASRPHQRRYSQSPSTGIGRPLVDDIDSNTSAPPSPFVSTTPSEYSKGNYVTVLDLAPLLSPAAHLQEPETIAEFMASKSQSISSLQFSADGTSLLTVPEDGQTLKVYQLKPASRAARAVRREMLQSPDVDSRLRAEEDAPWHMYDLRRGRTSAVVEQHEWAPDGRWIAVGSRNRTVHVFATNPYGGKSEEQSHLKGRVFNYTKLPLSTTLSPIVRVRPTSSPTADRGAAPLVFTFIDSNTHSLPKRLLPPLSVHSPSSSSPPSTQSSPSQEPLSPVRLRRPTNFQDVLLFDPVDGTISLRRVFVDLRSQEHSLSVPGAIPGIGGTSISLPTRSSFGRPNTSPSANVSGLSQMMQKPTDLAGHVDEVATWNVRRGHDWPVVTRSVANTAEAVINTTGKLNWLAHAELQTSSLSMHVLPRPVYLSHQFSFYELTGDYHGLIRRHHFDVPGPKIEVRKEVEVSAYSKGVGESFVQGSLGVDIGLPSSFDEPLSSAMASDLEYPSSPPVIPMLPNGPTGSRPSSFKNTIPIQRMTSGISDGMSEGLGRLRREIGKVRSPRMLAKSDHTATGEPVTLEFDEEDEDFLLSYPSGHEDDVISRSTSRGEGGSAASISTPSSGVDVLEQQGKGGDGVWLGWETEDRQAVEDAEQFHEISVVGFMDEEQAQMKGRGRGN
ncbi:hypothetical protein FA95DRAFT_1534680 [Auriscalpium vulgare]|uniref:Uncharacterized protein n=1 Tax=Auriscalpium vulgare TaxID=40419 RepID=A0ACB8S4W5_9AGAM|nr:hypothetical protein FA95DRAFT_1534680 [Auriscalpium vulgare]